MAEDDDDDCIEGWGQPEMLVAAEEEWDLTCQWWSAWEDWQPVMREVAATED